ncbi:hypothetical protein [Sebaldella sp. S0638]|uniref:hypothetical protein n=1 Tax=Sebaldella sp. S0638 TaxID=2957809 RepID=UPI00209FE47B|nr:hypothetical protein [Sebaldella sp. S0638]MCP1225474.1 hypothetical protein [Sebaldella sp. S0638]
MKKKIILFILITILINSCYKKKEKTFIFDGKVLPDSDVRTFIVHDELQVKKGIYYKAEDKNNYYEYGKAVLEK